MNSIPTALFEYMKDKIIKAYYDVMRDEYFLKLKGDNNMSVNYGTLEAEKLERRIVDLEKALAEQRVDINKLLTLLNDFTHHGLPASQSMKSDLGGK